MKELDRFIKYVKIDTQSDDTTGTTPSTEKQKNLGRLLVKELKELGLEDAFMDEFGIVYAHLKGEGETIGLNAHMDTALEIKGENVIPQIIKNYDGKDILLNKDTIFSVKDFPILKNHIGHDLIVTDGTTLLGADDKAGIAIIMNVLEYLKNNPSFIHHPLSIAFTVDEEIGEGPLHFDLKKMNASYCYTIDGADINDVGYENFNAVGVTLKIKGVTVHPGEGKDKLINAVLVFIELMNLMPKNDSPFDSEDKEGFWHINDATGNGEEFTCNFIIRDFELQGIQNRIDIFKNAVKTMQNKYKTAQISYEIKNQYENMNNFINNKIAIEKASNAIIKNGLKVTHLPIRGGTDGATFTKMGMITPNLGTGSYNHHGKFEFLDIQEFLKMINIVLDIIKY